MAAGKLGSDAAAGVAASSLVTVMARNGTDFGIRLSGTGEQWFTAPAPPVDGLYLGAFTEEDASPDIGDSTITETVGLGGLAMAAAPAIVGFVGGTASGAVRRTLAHVRDNACRAPVLPDPDARVPRHAGGHRCGPSGSHRCAPADQHGHCRARFPAPAWSGPGLVEAPMACFAAGINALAASSGLTVESWTRGAAGAERLADPTRQ